VRNSGWYIPFWRKPKRPQGDAAPFDGRERRRKPRARSDEELEHVRVEWVGRYTRQVQALRLLGLSVGVPQDDVDARYRQLLAEARGTEQAAERRHKLDEAYEALRPQ